MGVVPSVSIDVDVTVFGVFTWNNGDVSGECSYLVSSGGAHCFTVRTSSSFVLYFFGTTKYACTISVFYISSTHFEPIPAQPKTRGIGDTLVFLSLLQALGSSRWYGLRRENQSSREGV